jgi:hypothetical protein
MIEKKEIVKNLLIIAGMIIFLFFCGLVIRIVDPGLFEVANTFFRYAFMIIIISMAVPLTYKIINDLQKQEMEEEEIKKADQKDE